MSDRPAAVVLATILLASPSLLGAEVPVPRTEMIEERLYLAPGVQFGAFSQELSLSLGVADVSKILNDSHLEFGKSAGGWVAGGLRVNGVAHSWSPEALHLLAFHSWGGIPWGFWPFGLEIALGGGFKPHATYGLLQLSYIAGITSRLELVATLQYPVGEKVSRSAGLSLAVFGVRYGFDLATLARERVITTREPAEAR